MADVAEKERERGAYLQGLVDSYLSLVYSCGLRQVKDAKLAEDVTQDVFLVAMKKSGALRSEWAAGWLVKVTRYVAIGALRREARRRKHERAAAEMRDGIGSDAMQSSDVTGMLGSKLDEGLAALRDEDRQLIVMRYLQARSVKEISAVLGISENTAAKRLQRALGRIRAYFGGKGITIEEAAMGTALGAFKAGVVPEELGSRIVSGVKSGAKPGLRLAMRGRLMLASVLVKLVCGSVAALMVVGGLFLAVQWAQGGAGQQPAVSKAAIVPVQTSAPVTGDAPKTVTLSGVVKDQNGLPLANILVSQGSADWIQGYKGTRTNANGQFTIRGISVGQELVLAAWGDRFAPELVKGVVPTNPDPFSFVMTQGKTLRFRVVDERGKPVARLEIDPREWRGTYVLEAGSSRNGRSRYPRTDANGVIEMRNAPADAVTFDPLTDDKYFRQNFTLTASDQLQTVVLRDPIKVLVKVVDDETGQPIANFKMVNGYGSKDEVYLWYENKAMQGTGGSLDDVLRWELAPRSYFRVEAAHYEPMVRNIGHDEGHVELVFRLKKEARPVVHVLKPDGSAAAGAEVYYVEGARNFSLESSLLLHDPQFRVDAPEILKTDDSGALRVKAEPDGTRLVVLSEAGIAVVAYPDAISGPVKLDGWASVKGRAMIGAEPARNAEIKLWYLVVPQPPYISGWFTTKSDGDGRFELSRVPPGKVTVGRWIETNSGSQFSQGTMASGHRLELKPAGSADVTIGGEGRPVVGRVVVERSATRPGDAPRHLIYSLGMIRGGNGGPEPKCPRPLQDELNKALAAPKDQRHALLAEFEKHAKPYQDTLDAWTAKQKYMAFVVGADGRFRVDDVEAGDYTMNVDVTNADNLKAVGHATTRFSVGEMSGGRSDEVLDLGDVAVEKAK